MQILIKGNYNSPKVERQSRANYATARAEAIKYTEEEAYNFALIGNELYESGTMRQVSDEEISEFWEFKKAEV